MPKHVCRSLFVFIAGEVAVSFVDIVDICSPSMFKLIFPPADFRRFLTVLVDRRLIGQPVLFEYVTGCEWHPSNQALQCPVVTIRCYPWSAGSWQIFHIVGLCVFSPVG